MLSQSFVTRYAKYNRLKSLLEEWLKEQREEIFKAMGVAQNPKTKAWSAKRAAPDKGPYLIEIGDAEEKPKWKEEFFKYLVSKGLTKEKAEAKLQKIADRQRGREPRLHCKVNPNYHRKFEIRLPA